MITQQIKNIEYIIKCLIKYHLNWFDLMLSESVNDGQYRWDFTTKSENFSSETHATFQH